MEFFRKFGTYEYLFIAYFLLSYLGYMWRVYSASMVLKLTLWKFVFKIFTRIIILILLFIALLGPNFGDVQTKEVKSIGRDIFMAIDLSKSMDAIDIVPSRLLKVKYEVKKIINSFKADRVGLIIFTSEAYIQCPLTYDHSAFNLFLETINTNLINAKGTDFSTAFNLAAEKFNLDNENNQETDNPKVLLLISDGEDFGENTDDAISELESVGVTLFCLGIGTEKGGRIKTRSGYKFDKKGKEIITHLDAESLQNIAESTQGNYYEISDKKNDVNTLIEDVKKIKGEVRSVKKQDTKTDKYYYFLSLATLLILFDVLFKFNLFKL